MNIYDRPWGIREKKTWKTMLEGDKRDEKNKSKAAVQW